MESVRDMTRMTINNFGCIVLLAFLLMIHKVCASLALVYVTHTMSYLSFNTRHTFLFEFCWCVA